MQLPVFSSFIEWANYIAKRLSRRKAYALGQPLSTTVNATGAQLQQQQFSAEELEPGIYTVQFDVQGPPLSGGGGPSFDAQATVTWKNNGNNVVRQLDVQQGTQISGCAEAINVTVVDKSTDADGAGNSYKVMVSLAAGPRGSFDARPILGVFSKNRAQVLANLATSTVQIPVGVGVISLKATANPAPTAANDVTVDIQNAAGQSLLKYGLSQHTEFVPIPGDASQVVFTNNTGANATIGAQWGIDG